MQVYSTLMKIAKKQIGQSFIYIGIFVLLISIMSKAQADNTENYADIKCKVAIFDYDNTDSSKKLSKYLSSIHEIKELEDEESVILDTLYLQNVDYILYINKGYSQDGKLTNIKRPGSSEGSYVDNQINVYESSMKALKAVGYSEEEAFGKTMDALNSDGLVSMYEKKTDKKPVDYYVFLYIPYVAAMLLFSILAPVLVAYNRKEVKDRATVSSMSGVCRNAQLALAVFSLSMIVWLVFAVLCVAFGGAGVFKDKLPLNFLNMLVYIVVVGCFVMIIGNFALKPQAVSMISNIYGLGTCFLGGVFVTLEIFGDGMLKLAHFMPTYWYVQALENTYDGKISVILSSMGMELVFAAIFFVINLFVIRKKRISKA